MTVYMDRIVHILRASVERNAERVWLRGDAIPVMRPSGATSSSGDIRMADFEAVPEADLHTFLAEIGIQMDASNRYGRLGSSFRVHAPGHPGGCLSLSGSSGNPPRGSRTPAPRCR